MFQQSRKVKIRRMSRIATLTIDRMISRGGIVYWVKRQRPLTTVAQEVKAQLRWIVHRAATITRRVALAGDDPKITHAPKMAQVSAQRPFPIQLDSRPAASLQTIEASRRNAQAAMPASVALCASRLPIQRAAQRHTGIARHYPHFNKEA